jgi:hypothetical protein
VIGSRRWQVLALVAMALIGVAFGIWLLRASFITLGWLWVVMCISLQIRTCIVS